MSFKRVIDESVHYVSTASYIFDNMLKISCSKNIDVLYINYNNKYYMVNGPKSKITSSSTNIIYLNIAGIEKYKTVSNEYIQKLKQLKG